MAEPTRGAVTGALSAEAEGSVLVEAVDRIAHQLKNPLQAISVNLEVVRLRAGEDGETDRLTRVMDDAVRTLDRRIRLLVALARRSPEEPVRVVDLASFVRETVAAFRLDDREHGRDVALRTPPGEVGPVTVRPGQLVALVMALSEAPTVGARSPRVLRVAGDGENGVLAVTGAADADERGSSEAGAGDGPGVGPVLRAEGERYRELAEQARVAGARPGAEGELRFEFPGAGQGPA